ncbi:hypothetical protein EYF80_021758 [Liparis tanakae]|uniref:Uncharacterized protein n=1 Tax=Liparis tanakae TaxID=230148 RepID=A0A4Z2HQ54_9TELE|nr:hypothetical protein EYF80_021758 [Liparis tanakae]
MAGSSFQSLMKMKGAPAALSRRSGELDPAAQVPGVLFEGIPLFAQSRVVVHLFILPRIPIAS